MSIFHLLVLAIMAVVYLVPIGMILGRAGFNKWWALVAAIPFANIIGLWVFATTPWPSGGNQTVLPPER